MTTQQSQSVGQQSRSIGARIALAGFTLAIIAAVVAIGIGLAGRFRALDYRTGFTIIEWVAYGGALAAVVSIVGAGFTLRRGRSALVLALIGVVIGSLTAWIPYQARMALRASPPLPDVTTDMENPPAFVVAVELRKSAGARNSLDYGPDKAALQRKHYPEISPVILKLPPDRAFERALAAVVSMKWEVIAADAAAGRIEAVDRTFWFGFQDDVVVRVTPAGDGSRIDIRSVSRVGRREAGVNAARIRRLAARIAEG